MRNSCAFTFLENSLLSVTTFKSRLLNSNSDQPWFVKGLVGLRCYYCDFFSFCSFHYCERCFDEIPGEAVNLGDDPTLMQRYDAPCCLQINFTTNVFILLHKVDIKPCPLNFILLFQSGNTGGVSERVSIFYSVQGENSKHNVSCFTSYNFTWPLFPCYSTVPKGNFSKTKNDHLDMEP